MNATGSRLPRALLCIVVLVAASMPLRAHHGTNISYDRSKQFTTQAVVKSFEYPQPTRSCMSSSRTRKAAS